MTLGPSASMHTYSCTCSLMFNLHCTVQYTIERFERVNCGATLQVSALNFYPEWLLIKEERDFITYCYNAAGWQNEQRSYLLYACVRYQNQKSYLFPTFLITQLRFLAGYYFTPHDVVLFGAGFARHHSNCRLLFFLPRA